MKVNSRSTENKLFEVVANDSQDQKEAKESLHRQMAFQDEVTRKIEERNILYLATFNVYPQVQSYIHEPSGLPGF